MEHEKQFEQDKGNKEWGHFLVNVFFGGFFWYNNYFYV